MWIQSLFTGVTDLTDEDTLEASRNLAVI